MSNLMGSFRYRGFIVISFLAGLSLLAIPFAKPSNVPIFLLFLGRLHPLILHFPIVLIMLVLVLEVSRRYFFPALGDVLLMIVLVTAALSTAVAVGAGFFLFASGDYSGDLIERHLWGGAITGALTFITLSLFLLHRSTGRFYFIYFLFLLLSNASVAYASHLGGSVTHGQNYLTEHLELMLEDAGIKTVRTEEQLLVYGDLIAPVFEAKCNSCHNAARAKGDFLIGSYPNLFKSGDSGNPGIVQGANDSSELVKRVLLPPGDEDHMPPEGKTPMTADEISLLKFWVASGASDTFMVARARQIDTVATVITRLIPELNRYRIRSEMARVNSNSLQDELLRVGTKLNINIYRDSLYDTNLFALSMTFPPVRFSNGNFQELSPFYEEFSRVSLASAGLDDDALYYVGQMANLRELYLQKNSFNGSGLVHLQNLKYLEVLNLSFTKVDDKAAIDLLKIPNLKKVYLYRTNTTPQVIEALVKYKPGLAILMEEGPYR